MNIYGKKQIAYWDLTFGVRSLFVSIEFEFNRIVQDKQNIAVT
jgi:hypothetical protein